MYPGFGSNHLGINGSICTEFNIQIVLQDGLDSGTLFEVGYAVSLGKKVVAYVENETEGALKMLAGTGCDIEKDFTTAMYKTCWYAAE